jgi:Domain of unknown function (DUF4252)
VKKIGGSAAVTIIVLSSFMLSGCWGMDHNFIEVKDSILSQICHNNRFRINAEFGLGSIGLAAARTVVGFSHHKDARFARELLSDVSSVQVGVYENIHKDGNLNMAFLRKLDAKMNNYGWNCIVKNYDHREASCVYIKYDGEEITNLFVISIEQDQVALVDVEGNLTRAALTAIREKNINVDL